MVPPDSHGISRAPCYLGNEQASRTDFAYGGLTLSAGPSHALQLPVRFLTRPAAGRRLKPTPTTPQTQPLPGLTRLRFSLLRFRSPLLPESRLFSLPAGTEMFHFPAFPPHCLCVQQRVTAHDDCRVSPFGHPRIKAWLTTPRGLSWPPTSFIGSWCQGIHRAPLKTWPQMLASTVQFSNNDQYTVTHHNVMLHRRRQLRKVSFPQTPNSVPGQLPSDDRAFHALASSTSSHRPEDPAE